MAGVSSILAGLLFLSLVFTRPTTAVPAEKITTGALVSSVYLHIAFELQPEQFGTYDAPIDALYSVPSDKQLERIHKACLKPGTFVPESFDCDDFAFEYFVRARKYAREKFLPSGAALAVGVLYVRIDGPLWDLGIEPGPFGPVHHALNIYLRNDGKWIVAEPQTGKLVPWECLKYEGNITICKVLI